MYQGVRGGLPAARESCVCRQDESAVSAFLSRVKYQVLSVQRFQMKLRMGMGRRVGRKGKVRIRECEAGRLLQEDHVSADGTTMHFGHS